MGTFHVLPASLRSVSAHRTKTGLLKATGSSTLFVSVNVSCLSLHVDPAMSRWLTTHKVKQEWWPRMGGILFLLFLLRPPITAAAWKGRHKQDGVDRRDWQAHCAQQRAHGALADTQHADEKSSNSVGKRWRVADELGHFRTDNNGATLFWVIW